MAYLTRRIAVSLVVLLGVAAVTFIMVRLIPGDPARIELGLHAKPEAVKALNHRWGLDQPILSQFGSYVGNLVTGHFGESISFGSSIGELVGSRIGPSALLLVYGVAIALLFGIPLGVISAVRSGGALDNLIRICTTFTFAMPTFWLGLMLSLLLGYELKWFPVSGYKSGLAGDLRTLTVPAITLALALLVVIVRNLRSSLLEALDSEYVEAARGRGFSQIRIVGKHAFRNSIIGTVTILAAQFGFLLGVMVFIETVFQIPGVGTLLVQAVQKRDYALIQSLVFLGAAVVVLAGLVTDATYTWLDPRVRLGGSS